MQKLVWLLNRDKLMHELAGMVMVDIFLLISLLMFNFITSVIISFTLSTLIMACKELIYDKLMHKGVCSLKDFIAGELAIIFQTIVFIISYII